MNSGENHSSGFVLLTGSTGLLGRQLLADFLRCHIPIVVLVRPAEGMSASARIEHIVAGIEQQASRRFVRPVVLSGNLLDENLGLSQEQQQWLQRHCRYVVHSAANLSFRPAAEHPDNEPLRTNIDGTANLVEICGRLGIRQFHYVSTAYVCGVLNGAAAMEAAPTRSTTFANDYERSKAEAECLLHECRELDQLTVYRPSIIVAPKTNTAVGTDQAIATAYSTYELLASRFGLPKPGDWLRNLGLNGTERKNIVSADWVSRMIVQIFRHPELHGNTYHLTNENGTQVKSLDKGFRRSVLAAHPQIKQAHANTDLQLLETLARPYVATFLPYFRDDPQFDRTNLMFALSRCNEHDAGAITAEEICRLTTIQPESTKDSFTTLPSVTAWSTFVTQHQSWTDSEPETGADSFGLILTGPLGGTWTIGICSDRVSITPGVSVFTTRRLYATTDNWSNLLKSETSVQNAMIIGQLLIECDDDSPTTHQWVIESLEQLKRATLRSGTLQTYLGVANVR